MTIFALLIAAGGAIVIQNLIMAQISAASSTPIIAMALNSVVGVSLLLALLAFRSGTAGFTELTAAFGWRSLIPGLLGTFFVFASLIGYQRLSAGTTISVLVTSQLIGGLVADAIRTGGARLGYADADRCGDARRGDSAGGEGLAPLGFVSARQINLLTQKSDPPAKLPQEARSRRNP